MHFMVLATVALFPPLKLEFGQRKSTVAEIPSRTMPKCEFHGCRHICRYLYVKHTIDISQKYTSSQYSCTRVLTKAPVFWAGREQKNFSESEKFIVLC